MPTTSTHMRLDAADKSLIAAIRAQTFARSDTEAVRTALKLAAKALKIDVKKILRIPSK